MQVVIDSSILVALLNPRDLWRVQALSLQDALLDAGATNVYFALLQKRSVRRRGVCTKRAVPLR